jgi:hypothetical protein
MSISILVQAAAAKPLSREIIERTCQEEKMQLSELYDAFARDVAEKYLRGEYGWRFCDDAMNTLFTYTHPVSLSGLPAFAFDVYCAFDEGEYRPEGEALSRKLIADALKKKEPIQPPQTTTGSSAPSRV